MTGTFEGVGTLQFSPDYKYAYAYSGSVAATSGADATNLDFTTEGEYLKGRFYFSLDEDDLGSGDQVGWMIQFNGITISMARVETVGTDLLYHNILPYIDLIIPPFTNVKGIAFTNTSSIDTFLTFTGEVKGAIQQVDLESVSDGSKWA